VTGGARGDEGGELHYIVRSERSGDTGNDSRESGWVVHHEDDTKEGTDEGEMEVR